MVGRLRLRRTLQASDRLIGKLVQRDTYLGMGKWMHYLGQTMMLRVTNPWSEISVAL